jgi:hypothetical protein
VVLGIPKESPWKGKLTTVGTLPGSDRLTYLKDRATEMAPAVPKERAEL